MQSWDPYDPRLHIALPKVIAVQGSSSYEVPMRWWRDEQGRFIGRFESTDFPLRLLTSEDAIDTYNDLTLESNTRDEEYMTDIEGYNDPYSFSEDVRAEDDIVGYLAANFPSASRHHTSSSTVSATHSSPTSSYTAELASTSTGDKSHVVTSSLGATTTQLTSISSMSQTDYTESSQTWSASSRSPWSDSTSAVTSGLPYMTGTSAFWSSSVPSSGLDMMTSSATFSGSGGMQQAEFIPSSTSTIAAEDLTSYVTSESPFLPSASQALSPSTMSTDTSSGMQSSQSRFLASANSQTSTSVQTSMSRPQLDSSSSYAVSSDHVYPLRSTSEGDSSLTSRDRATISDEAAETSMATTSLLAEETRQRDSSSTSVESEKMTEAGSTSATSHLDLGVSSSNTQEQPTSTAHATQSSQQSSGALMRDFTLSTFGSSAEFTAESTETFVSPPTTPLSAAETESEPEEWSSLAYSSDVSLSSSFEGTDVLDVTSSQLPVSSSEPQATENTTPRESMSTSLIGTSMSVSGQSTQIGSTDVSVGSSPATSTTEAARRSSSDPSESASTVRDTSTSGYGEASSFTASLSSSLSTYRNLNQMMESSLSTAVTDSSSTGQGSSSLEASQSEAHTSSNSLASHPPSSSIADSTSSDLRSLSSLSSAQSLENTQLTTSATHTHSLLSSLISEGTYYSEGDTTDDGESTENESSENADSTGATTDDGESTENADSTEATTDDGESTNNVDSTGATTDNGDSTATTDSTGATTYHGDSTESVLSTGATTDQGDTTKNVDSTGTLTASDFSESRPRSSTATSTFATIASSERPSSGTASTSPIEDTATSFTQGTEASTGSQSSGLRRTGTAGQSSLDSSASGYVTEEAMTSRRVSSEERSHLTSLGSSHGVTSSGQPTSAADVSNSSTRTASFADDDTSSWETEASESMYDTTVDFSTAYEVPSRASQSSTQTNEYYADFLKSRVSTEVESSNKASSTPGMQSETGTSSGGSSPRHLLSTSGGVSSSTADEEVTSPRVEVEAKRPLAFIPMREAKDLMPLEALVSDPDLQSLGGAVKQNEKYEVLRKVGMTIFAPVDAAFMNLPIDIDAVQDTNNLKKPARARDANLQAGAAIRRMRRDSSSPTTANSRPGSSSPRKLSDENELSDGDTSSDPKRHLSACDPYEDGPCPLGTNKLKHTADLIGSRFTQMTDDIKRARNKDVLEDFEKLIMFHVVKRIIPPGMIEAKQKLSLRTEFKGRNLEVGVYTDAFEKKEVLVAEGQAKVIEIVVCRNGFIYKIDRPLFPAWNIGAPTLVDGIRSNPRFTKLRYLLDKTGMFDAWAQAGPVTMLLIPDEAWKIDGLMIPPCFFKALVRPENADLLGILLKWTTIPGLWKKEDIQATTWLPNGAAPSLSVTTIDMSVWSQSQEARMDVWTNRESIYDPALHWAHDVEALPEVVPVLERGKTMTLIEGKEVVDWDIPFYNGYGHTIAELPLRPDIDLRAILWDCMDMFCGECPIITKYLLKYLDGGGLLPDVTNPKAYIVPPGPRPDWVCAGAHKWFPPGWDDHEWYKYVEYAKSGNSKLARQLAYQGWRQAAIRIGELDDRLREAEIHLRQIWHHYGNPSSYLLGEKQDPNLLIGWLRNKRSLEIKPRICDGTAPKKPGPLLDVEDPWDGDGDAMWGGPPVAYPLGLREDFYNAVGREKIRKVTMEDLKYLTQWL